MRFAQLPLQDGLTKGLPASLGQLPPAQVGRQGWNVLAEDLPLPLALLKDSSLRHNSQWMRRFLAMAGASIAPHGKTSMSPQLFARQLADGAWGITVATVQQLRVCRAAGVDRVLMANQLVGRQAVGYVLDELARDPKFEFLALVDSVSGVELLAQAAARRNPGRPLKLLVECGFRGGRAGCRNLDEALVVARAVARARPHLGLAGVEGFEGAVPAAGPEEQDRRVREFVAFMAQVASAAAAEGLIDDGEVILSAGGSAWFDLAAELPHQLGDRSARVVLRSGCYLTHDSDMYTRAAKAMRERSPAVADLGPGLRDALEVWAHVQSLPEPGLAILGMGKRDVSYDLHLPYPRMMVRPGATGVPAALPDGCEITALNDQHAFMRLPPDAALAVGDLIGCTISHPCTTFDKWRFLPIVDDQYNVIEGISTWF
ncbi:MAG: amino acid deaminase [Burkholderiales bacterium]|nr:amino acid deaminase [Burkholderiales bacterium]